MRRNTVIIATILSLIFVAAGCGPKEKKTVSTEQIRKEQGFPVVTETASVQSLRRTVHFTGTVNLPDTVTVLPLVGGVVKKIHVDKGDLVSKGTPMLEIERTDYAHGVAQAEAAVAAAQAQYLLALNSQNNKNVDSLRHKEWSMCIKNAEAARAGYKAAQDGYYAVAAGYDAAAAGHQFDLWNLQRMENLYNAGVVAEQVYQGAKTQEEASRKQLTSMEHQLRSTKEQLESTNYQIQGVEIQCAIADEGPKELEVAMAKAQYEQAKAALASARTSLGRTTLRSDVDGVVSLRMAVKGQTIGPGSPAFQVLRRGDKKISLFVNQDDLPFVKEGQDVVFSSTAIPGKTFKATISYVAPFVLEMSREAMVEAFIQDDAIDLSHGMFVEGDITLDPMQKLAINYKAVLENEIVWVADPEMKATKKICKDLERVGDYLIIKDACIKLGEKIVVKGQNLLSEGNKLKFVSDTKKDKGKTKKSK